ncbi:MAG TPA: hypothetical protein H9837_09515 [Candidatus Brachybacterium merdigallinarum]|nr:hypothetical protein [Candidatus Brachybacterium merdigallinarum]
MTRILRGLVPRLLLAVAAVLLLVIALRLIGMHLALPVPLAVALAGGALWWIVGAGAEVAIPLESPELNLDPGYALPHAQDPAVRRIEDTLYGAQPRRRTSTRALGQLLGRLADQREHRAGPQGTPPLSPALQDLIGHSRDPKVHDAPRPVDRRFLHRILHELATPER